MIVAIRRCRCHLNIKQTNLSHLICIHSFHLSVIPSFARSFVWLVGWLVDLLVSETYEWQFRCRQRHRQNQTVCSKVFRSLIFIESCCFTKTLSFIDDDIWGNESSSPTHWNHRALRYNSNISTYNAITHHSYIWIFFSTRLSSSFSNRTFPLSLPIPFYHIAWHFSIHSYIKHSHMQQWNYFSHCLVVLSMRMLCDV